MAPPSDRHEPLTSSEAVLWTIERDPVLRSTIVAIVVLDRAVDMAVLRRRCEAAVERFPRLRQRVAARPLGLPTWRVVTQFDVSAHLVEVSLPPPGSWRQLLDLAGHQAGTAFDRERPLWQVTVVDGLEQGRSAVLLKVHHAVTDGIGGVELLPLLLDVDVADLSPGEDPAPPAGPEPDRSPLGPGRSLASWLRQGPKALASTARLLAPATTPLSPLATGRGLDRHLETLEVPLTALATAGRAAGGTVNDAFLAAVAGGLGRYHDRHGVHIHQLRVTMPVNLRRASDHQGGDRFVPVRFCIPVDIHDPVQRMRTLGGLSRAWRRDPAIQLTDVLAAALSRLPDAATTELFGSMLTGVDAVATNVPGPRASCRLASANVVGLFGFGPTSGAGLSVALFSHAGTCGIGINTDTVAIPDPDVLRECVEAGFREVLDAQPSSFPLTPAPTAIEPAADAGATQRLSALDTSFLVMENARTPMHVGALLTLEGGPLLDEQGCVQIDRIRQEVAERLDRCPRMRQRPIFVPLHIDRPQWCDDSEFDITNHVRTVRLPSPGTRAQLAELCAELQMAVLDRSRPLWEMWFVDGLADGSVALVYKVHHAVVDGVSAARTFEMLLGADDGAASPSATRAMAPRATAPRAGPVDASVRVLAGLRRTPGPLQLFASAGAAAASIRSLSRTRPTSLNVQVGQRRQLRTVTLDLAEVKAIAKHYDATVNDVVLALVASGLRALFRSRGEHARAVRALVPVSLRPPGGGQLTGNQVAAVLVDLPLDVASPVAVLEAIGAETRRLKVSDEVEAMARALSSADTWPPATLAAIGPLVRHQPWVNLVVTNVRGPAERLQLLGADITEIVPIVPLGPNLTCGVAVLSYSGQLVLGVHVDPDRVPDAGRLIGGIRRALGRLRRAC